MATDTQNVVEDLLKRVEELEAWKAAREAQQLSFPLDFTSQQILIGSTGGFTGSGTYTTFTIRAGIVLAAS